MSVSADSDTTWFRLVCDTCGVSSWYKDEGRWSCTRCNTRFIRMIRLEGVNEMAFKKHGVGEVLQVEETEITKSARKGDFTEDDERALAAENADVDKDG